MDTGYGVTEQHCAVCAPTSDIGSPGASAFWYTAERVPCVVCIFTISSKHLQQTCCLLQRNKYPFFRKGGMYKPWKFLVLASAVSKGMIQLYGTQ